MSMSFGLLDVQNTNLKVKTNKMQDEPHKGQRWQEMYLFGSI